MFLFSHKSCFNGDDKVACLTGRAKSNVVKLGVRATLIKCHTTAVDIIKCPTNLTHALCVLNFWASKSMCEDMTNIRCHHVIIANIIIIMMSLWQNWYECTALQSITNARDHPPPIYPVCILPIPILLLAWDCQGSMVQKSEFENNFLVDVGAGVGGQNKNKYILKFTVAHVYLNCR